MTTKREPTAAEAVGDIAEREIEAIRLALCPTENDVELVDDGTLDTVLRLGDREIRIAQDEAYHYRDDDGSLDLASLVASQWDEIREQAYGSFHEHGLGFYYVDREGHEHHWCYLISTGGPGTEIRFFANHDLTLHRAEFWYLPWFDGACVRCTNDVTVVALWEYFVECDAAEHARSEENR